MVHAALRSFFFACALLFGALQVHAQAAAPAAWPTAEWPVSTPEAEGMDPAVLAELYDYLATPSFNTDSVIVVRNGRIVSETYVAPFHAGLRHDLRSVTKSVVATLVGAAIQEGKIASDREKVLSFFPEHKANGPMQEALTVRHLLDMTSGIEWREWPYNAETDPSKLWASTDWTKFILERKVTAEPGAKFQYIAAAPHLLSVILTRSTGSNAADYARRHVFKSMGIEDFGWRSDPQGHSVGESALRLKTRDLAKLGLLHLRDGRWEDKQLLPPGWTQALFTPAGAHGTNLIEAPPAYRGLWWIDASVPYAAALGRHAQRIIAMPKQDVVLVVTSKTADASRAASPQVLVNRYLLPAVKSDAALPAEAAARNKLALAVQRFANPIGFESREPSSAAKALSRRRFILEPNAWGYREFSLELSASEPYYRLLQADKSTLLGESVRGGAMGLNGRYIVSTRAGDRLWARRGRWIDESAFRIETQQLEGAIIAEWTARFENGRLELTYTNGDGDALTMRGTPKD